MSTNYFRFSKQKSFLNLESITMTNQYVVCFHVLIFIFSKRRSKESYIYNRKLHYILGYVSKRIDYYSKECH